MNSKILTIALDSSDDDEAAEDPLKISPPMPPIGTHKRLFGVSINAIGPTNGAVKRMRNTSTPRRIAPVTLSKIVSLSPHPPFVDIDEPEPIIINVKSVPVLNQRPVVSICFKKFTDACRAADSSEDMTRALKRVFSRYYACDQHFTYSKQMVRLLEEKTEKVQNNRGSVYSQLSDVLTALKKGCSLKEMSNNSSVERLGSPPSTSKQYSQPVTNQPSPSRSNDLPSTSRSNDLPSTNGDQPSTSRSSKQPTLPSGTTGRQLTVNGHKKREETSEEEDDPEEVRRMDKYNSLRRALKECDAVIRRLEQKEVDWDDDDNSSYIKLQRYRERCTKIHRKMCELSGKRGNDHHFRPRVHCNTKFPAINKCIEKFVHKQRIFPDFADILKLCRACNESEGLNLRPMDLHQLAQTTFESIGNQLQRQRQMSDWNIHSIYLESSEDPADVDPELNARLNDNLRTGKARIQEVISSFGQKQATHGDEAEKTDEEETDSSSSDDSTESVADTNVLSTLGLISADVDTEESTTSFLNERTGLIEVVEPVSSTRLDCLAELEDGDIAVAEEMEVSTESSSQPLVAPVRSTEPVVVPEPAAEAVDAPEPAAEAVDAPEPAAEAVDAPEPAAKAVDAPEPVAEAVDASQPATESVDVPEPSVSSTSHAERTQNGAEKLESCKNKSALHPKMPDADIGKTSALSSESDSDLSKQPLLTNVVESPSLSDFVDLHENKISPLSNEADDTSPPSSNADDTTEEDEPDIDLESLISPTVIPKDDFDAENVVFVSSSHDLSIDETIVTSKEQCSDDVDLVMTNSAEDSFTTNGAKDSVLTNKTRDSVITNNAKDSEISATVKGLILENAEATPIKAVAVVECKLEENSVEQTLLSLPTLPWIEADRKRPPTIVALSTNKLLKRDSSHLVSRTGFKPTNQNSVKVSSATYPLVRTECRKPVTSIATNIDTCFRNGVTVSFSSNNNNLKRRKCEDDIITID